MVSDFITEKDGYLCLTQTEYDAAKIDNPNITMGARKLLEYGESRVELETIIYEADGKG